LKGSEHLRDLDIDELHYGDLEELGCEGLNWIQVAQVTVQWWAVVTTVMKIPFP
jgi:hypothetical protein